MRIEIRKEVVQKALYGAAWAANRGAFVMGGVAIGMIWERRKAGQALDVAIDETVEAASQLQIDFSRESVERELNSRIAPLREALDAKNDRIEELNREVQHLKDVAKQTFAADPGDDGVEDEPKIVSSSTGRRNMFDAPEPRGVDAPFEFDDDERGPSAPYTISRVEFGTLHPEYEQLELRYFAGDDMLVDPQGTPIYNYVAVVGGKLEFGRGSGDSNVVYICNENLRAKYEITRSETSYESYAMGLMAEDEAADEDLRHSSRLPRFRQE